MATIQANEPAVKKALLFMPDISGFTRFVNDTEILHSQQIIEELLEVLLDSNHIGMQVSEIEGDAIFFYRMGEKPSLSELLRQVETMYYNFHYHLIQYAHNCVCSCKACQSANTLKLKMLAHYGEVAELGVKQHRKLFGKDVILIHRLLKNNIGRKEYVLFTDPVAGNETIKEDKPWYNECRGVEVYDAGEVQFRYSPLDNLEKRVPPSHHPHSKKSLSSGIGFIEEAEIEADAESVFSAILDLHKRPEWMEGVKAVEMLDHHKINRPGTQHCCVVKGKNNPIIVTESVSRDGDIIEIVEMDKKGTGGCRYRIEKLAPGKTLLQVQLLVKKNPLVKLMFSLFMKKKYQENIRQSLINLREYLAKQKAALTTSTSS